VTIVVFAGWRLMGPGSGSNESRDAVPSRASLPPAAAPAAETPVVVEAPSPSRQAATTVAETTPGERLRSQALTAWKRGDLDLALINMAAAAQLGPDAANDRLLAEFSSTSRDRALSARRRAQSANGRGTTAYGAGDGRLSEGETLAAKGQTIGAIRAYADAANRFEEATASAPPPAPVRPACGRTGRDGAARDPGRGVYGGPTPRVPRIPLHGRPRRRRGGLRGACRAPP